MVMLRADKSGWTSGAARRLVKLAGGDCSVEQAIETIVAGLLTGVTYPPTDLAKLKSKLRISTIRGEQLPFSGELRSEENGFSIAYSSHLSASRRRFTIAHEMAHAIFAQTGSRCPKTGRELERLCDMIAAEILMPRDAFVKTIGNDTTVKNLFHLAKTFKTSLAATALRLTRFRKVDVFETDSHTIQWGYGIVKKKPVAKLDSHLQTIIMKAVQGSAGRQQVFLTVGNFVRRYDVDYQPVGGSKAIVIMAAADGQSGNCG